MNIPRIILSMGYIDDGFITDSVLYKPAKSKHLWVKFTGLAACAVLILTAAVTLPFSLKGSHTTDPFRVGACEEITDLHGFSETYGKSVLVLLADFLKADDNLSYSVELWYDEGKAADDPDAWNTLITSAKSDEYSFTLYSFFEGHINDYKVSMVFTEKNTRVVDINGTTVLIAPHPLSGEAFTEWDFWDYAIFEHGEAVYDLRVSSNSQSTMMDLLREIIPRLDNE